jgi:O-succinylbenzoic acid--CoA ligase
VVVDSWLERAAAAHPQRAAVNALTYAELLARARAGASALRGRGVGPGDRVALALPPGDELCVALHAVLLAGAVAVPVDGRLEEAERAAVIDGAPVVDAALPAAGGAGAERVEHDLDAPAIIVHTSGTSGAPKRVALTYGNWLWSALGSATALGLDPAERWLSAMPLSHVGGLSIVMRSAICAKTAIVHERFETERVLAALRDPSGPTVASLVPTTLARLLDAGLERPPSLRWALVGGAPVPDALLDRAAAAGVPVAATYGLTEACSQVATLGAPLFCTRVRVADDGEILVAGPTVAPGAADADGWLHTGDLGAFDDDGSLSITGRAADTIITGGENVAPGEVEAVLEDHPAVAEAAVHGRPDPAWGEAVHATVVVHPGAGVSEAALRAFASPRLAAFKVPKTITFAKALPRTASGKLLRRAL